MNGLLLTTGDPADIPAVSTYTLTGPTSATVGLPSDPFTVTLGAGTLAGSVKVTPGDGAAPGTFSVAFVTLSLAAPSATFTYTPGSAGSVTISVTNDGGLTDPAPIVLNASDAPTPDDFRQSPIVMLTPAATLWYRGVR